jgi:DNA-binding transcriptional regulator YdaS (Cro superfamily)
MAQQEQTAQIVYNPNNLLDTLIKRMGLKDDGALSRKLRVATTVISNIRYGRLPVGASMLMWINEATGISIHELRELMGDRRTRYRLSYAMSR